MNKERMNRFVENVRKQRREEYCKKGHYYEGENYNCRNCGKSIEAALEIIPGRDAQ